MRRYFYRLKLLLTLFALLALLGIVCMHIPLQTKAAPTCGTWTVMVSPDATSSYNRLDGIASITASDIWAVGSANSANSSTSTLTEHWNGSQWSIIPSPNVTTNTLFNGLKSVAALATNDVWAVGSFIDTGYSRHTLTEHWDGSQWSIIPSANPGIDNELYSVTALSSNDVWAVGQTVVTGPTIYHTLIEHWDGVQWNVIPSPNPGSGYNELNAVLAFSSHNVWAVGDSATTSTQTLFEHWDGTQWNVVASPQQQQHGSLNALSAIDAHHIWAVGYHSAPQGSDSPALIDQWNGARWKLVGSPPVSTMHHSLASVVALSTTNAWAVGTDIARNVSTPFAEHWDGTGWTLAPLPDTGFSALYGIAGILGQVWAVGTRTSGGVSHTLIESYC